jgi:hypothetical protein
MGESIIHPSIHQSCEIILDGHQIAKYAPLPGKSNRSVKPDAYRYFETHKWILKPAQRVKFQPGIMNILLKVLKHRKALKIDCHAQNGYYSDIILTVICYFIA